VRPIISRSIMPVEHLSYADIANRLGTSAAAARSLARRLRLPRILDNRGHAIVSIDFAEIAHNKRPAPDRPPDDQAVMDGMIAIRERLAVLGAELAAERERAADDRAAAQRDRGRLDQIATSVAELKVVAQATAARPLPWWRRWGL
jgi:hypothetical protein